MKFTNISWKIRLASALFLGSAAVVCNAQNSPVGSWDCVMSGPRDGLAYLIFFDDNTFTNLQVLVPKALPGPISDPRTLGDNGRVTTTNTPAQTLQRIFGWEGSGGPWTYDSQGHVIGYWVELSDVICTTNALPLFTNTFVSPTLVASTNVFDTNNEYCVTQPIGIDPSTNYIEQQICYSNSIGCTATTNQLSFTAKVVPGRHINLVTSSFAGKVTYNGTPAVTLSDISGSYYATKKVPNEPWTIEFFTLISTDPMNHFYEVIGAGPAYAFGGVGLFSIRNKLALAARVNPDDLIIRAVDGAFNPVRKTGTLKGLEQHSGEEKPRISLSISHQ